MLRLNIMVKGTSSKYVFLNLLFHKEHIRENSDVKSRDRIKKKGKK